MVLNCWLMFVVTWSLLDVFVRVAARSWRRFGDSQCFSIDPLQSCVFMHNTKGWALNILDILHLHCFRWASSARRCPEQCKCRMSIWHPFLDNIIICVLCTSVLHHSNVRAIFKTVLHKGFPV